MHIKTENWDIQSTPYTVTKVGRKHALYLLGMYPERRPYHTKAELADLYYALQIFFKKKTRPK